ncbi:hypothetical protein P106B_17 [Rhizobium phage vB_RglS_P106B]|uniref:Uncharacterized protein n=1 Tax=Rhizobium phage vB_RglS_P106B TaxID=1458697 RepID=W6E8E3_9CAUD|nr:hypothetical protein P106B_17 [Rhizobium phage vB_RglS_P106B]AHJ10700.1 hypothetical protein P106B_17 [Rhizobium phage vB_RglS_P106B]
MKTALNLITATAFANGAAAAVATDANKKAGAPKAEDRVAPVFTTVRTDIKPPVAAKRGAKSELAIKLDELPVGGSIGLTNKTKKQISSTISKVNNNDANLRQKVDAAGQPVMKTGEAIKDASGAIVGHQPSVPEMEKVKEFAAYDVDPKKDEDKATVRIFRLK